MVERWNSRTDQGMTARGKASDLLWTRWKECRGTEPDETSISEVLDEIEHEYRYDADGKELFEAATERLNL